MFRELLMVFLCSGNIRKTSTVVKEYYMRQRTLKILQYVQLANLLHECWTIWPNTHA